MPHVSGCRRRVLGRHDGPAAAAFLVVDDTWAADVAAFLAAAAPTAAADLFHWRQQRRHRVWRRRQRRERRRRPPGRPPPRRSDTRDTAVSGVKRRTWWPPARRAAAGKTAASARRRRGRWGWRQTRTCRRRRGQRLPCHHVAADLMIFFTVPDRSGRAPPLPPSSLLLPTAWTCTSDPAHGTLAYQSDLCQRRMKRGRAEGVGQSECREVAQTCGLPAWAGYASHR